MRFLNLKNSYQGSTLFFCKMYFHGYHFSFYADFKNVVLPLWQIEPETAFAIKLTNFALSNLLTSAGIWQFCRNNFLGVFSQKDKTTFLKSVYNYQFLYPSTLFREKLILLPVNSNIIFLITPTLRLWYPVFSKYCQAWPNLPVSYKTDIPIFLLKTD